MRDSAQVASRLVWVCTRGLGAGWCPYFGAVDQGLLSLFSSVPRPVTQLDYCLINALHKVGRLKFELTNQDLAGGKNCTVLTSTYANRKSMEFRPLFLTGDCIRYSRNGICNSKSHTRLCLQASNLAPKIGCRCPATHWRVMWVAR